jgi:acyl-CoA reductase-like NAD-dependent aldehyde dehydrogenase
MTRDCRAGNIYVNRKITGARVGIEPFGGFQLSGTGPKTGGEEYVLAFMKRRQGYRSVTPVKVTAADYGRGALAGFVFLEGLRPWDGVSAMERQGRLAAALETVSRDDSGLSQALGRWQGVEPEALVGNVVDTAGKVLAAVKEIIEPQHTVKIPGQTNYVRWDTPLGIGLAAADDGAEPRELAALLFGALLAGNGLVVSSGPNSYPAAQLMIDSLIAGGVPADVVCLAPRGYSPEILAAAPINFAALSLGQDETRAVYKVLGVTNEESGQRWLKAMISLNEGPQPGEAGFLRLFAHTKTIAVQTLRHGADLELI